MSNYIKKHNQYLVFIRTILVAALTNYNELEPEEKKMLSDVYDLLIKTSINYENKRRIKETVAGTEILYPNISNKIKKYINDMNMLIEKNDYIVYLINKKKEYDISKIMEYINKIKEYFAKYQMTGGTVRPSSVRPSSVRPSSVRPSSVRPSSDMSTIKKFTQAGRRVLGLTSKDDTGQPSLHLTDDEELTDEELTDEELTDEELTDEETKILDELEHAINPKMINNAINSITTTHSDKHNIENIRELKKNIKEYIENLTDYNRRNTSLNKAMVNINKHYIIRFLTKRLAYTKIYKRENKKKEIVELIGEREHTINSSYDKIKLQQLPKNEVHKRLLDLIQYYDKLKALDDEFQAI